MKTKTNETKITRQQAIRKKCLDCCSGSKNEVRECGIQSCSLWGFRLGKYNEKQ